MSCRIEMVEDRDPIGVGTTGTIGSLMCRELESMRRMEHLQKTARRVERNDAVSISCGRPLPSLSGYRLSIGTRKPQDASGRNKSYDGSTTPRSSNADGCDGRKTTVKDLRRASSRNVLESGESESPSCRSRLGLGRQESLPNFGGEGRRTDCWSGKVVQRKSVSLDGLGAAAAFADVFCAKGDPAATPTRGRGRERGGEFRTPMLRCDGKEGEIEEASVARSARKSTERRGGVPASVCSFVEVVDLKCNGSDKIWGSPIANRLRRLSFSRLSDAV